MDDWDDFDSEVLAALKREGLFEVSRKRTYFGYRGPNAETDNIVDDTKEVTIGILDRGPEHRDRFSCVATTNDGRTARGNPAATVEEAVTIVHWGDLDRPAKRSAKA